MKKNCPISLQCIDAAYQAELQETQKWELRFENEEKRIQKNKVKREKSILKTKVDFEMMDVQ